MNNAVMQEYVTASDGETYFVSTVYLNVFGANYPLLYETMVFDCTQFDVFCTRYTTLASAEAGHRHTVQNIDSVLGLDTSGNI